MIDWLKDNWIMVAITVASIICLVIIGSIVLNDTKTAYNDCVKRECAMCELNDNDCYENVCDIESISCNEGVSHSG